MLFHRILWYQHYVSFCITCVLLHFVASSSHFNFINSLKKESPNLWCRLWLHMCTVYLLLDEESTIGIGGSGCHGPNPVISVLHYHLSNFILREFFFRFMQIVAMVKIKAKLCYLISYFILGMVNGPIKHFTIIFMGPGHTKCCCDLIFGIGKSRSRTIISITLMNELGQIIDQSSKYNNVLQVRNKEWQHQIACRQWITQLSYL